MNTPNLIDLASLMPKTSDILGQVFEGRVDADSRTYRVWNKHTGVVVSEGEQDNAAKWIMDNFGFCPIEVIKFETTPQEDAAILYGLKAQLSDLTKQWERCDDADECEDLEDRMAKLEAAIQGATA